MESFEYKGWLIREVRYPVIDRATPAVFGDNRSVAYTDLKTVTQIEMIWTEWPYPTQENIIEGVYQVRARWGIEPSVIVAGFPAKFQGIEIR